jgi:acyl-CoA synthetase (AMP-forming)/AMP-acid ligase II
VLVVDPETREPVPDGTEGEIWAAGPSVAVGYWNDAERTEAVFGARLADGGGPWLRTGDLGVTEQDGELTVTGRIKDLVIVAGRNIHPEDIEAAIRSVEDERLRRGAIAAFGAEVDGRERVVIAVELRRRPGPEEDLAGLRTAIAGAVSRAFAVTVHDVVFLGPGEIPRTSSGKLRRHQCAKDYMARRDAQAAPRREPELAR